MGLGMQSWITRLKPSKFLSKRSKQDGGGIEKMFGIDAKDYYHYKKRDLKNLLKKEGSNEYKKQLIATLLAEKRKEDLIDILIAAIIIVIICILAIIFVPKLNSITLVN
ncbi:MAG: hypothetical protein HQ541_23120 [Mariniphaga sp.]|nr:hypothetical protein [Mariniphaga sp.]